MKIFISAILIVSVIILSFFSFQDIDLRDDLIISSNEAYDTYLSEQNISDIPFSIKEKELIYLNQLELILTSEKVDYITPSQNSYIYEIDYSIEQLLVKDIASDIQIASHLFQSADDVYHLFITYEKPHRVSGKHFFTLHHSEDITLDFVEQYITLYDEGDQYVIGGSGFQIDPLLDGYLLNSFSLSQYFKNPKTRGFYHFILAGDIASIESYLEIDVDFYQDVTQTQNEFIILGFNGFRGGSNQPSYIPQSIEIIYMKEDN